INKSQPELYLNENGNLKKTNFLENIDINASVVNTADFDNDGFEDIFIGSNSGYGSYGKSVDAMILINENGIGFSKATAYNKKLANLGMLYDVSIVDLDKDGLPDVVLAGHYMPITMLMNSGDGKFVKKEIRDSEGWWNSVAVEDLDGDGDYDIIAGNWGLNTRLKATLEKPLQLYLNDFDDNGRVDPILTYFDNGRETPLATKDELTKQIPQLNKSFLSYKDFAKADFNDYFSKEKIGQAERKKVVTLETTIFENKGDLKFSKSEMPREVQFSSVHAILLTDLDEDGLKDLVIGGNNYHVNTQLGRQDASKGLILKNKGNLNFDLIKNRLHINGAVKSIKNIKVLKENYLIFGINNSETEFVKYPRTND
ncbi:MAG: VCBS repeat-containing protein, partial [Gramella sp.]|nr:VCBS repeat-containing protein [Christiangramia sp.]